MKFIADFHIHSHYSIATSKKLVPEHLDYWGRMKGIKVVGTGDFTHPGWVDELQEKLEPAEQGLYKLKPGLRIDSSVPNTQENEVRFLLTAEISNIYKKHDKTRKIHNVVFAPDFETVRKIQNRLSSLNFNITSDGRPILGLDSRDLLELCLEASESIFFVPAHIWTPWFSAMGAKSGFDSIVECYDDLAHHIKAIETGLSSDPAMNWLCTSIDPYTIISNSDAHSPEKLGREGNLFSTELSYTSMMDALSSGDPNRFLGTLEFFPQEGKYHHDGHRKCDISWEPHQTREAGGVCPVCSKPVTMGVLHRVMQLADRQNGKERPNRHDFHSIIPLKEILSELHGVGPNSKTIAREYAVLIQKLGTELGIILDVPVEDIANNSGELLAEAIRRMRTGKVHVKAGYDGEFGVIKVFAPDEIKQLKQISLFKEDPPDVENGRKKIPSVAFQKNQNVDDHHKTTLEASDALEKPFQFNKAQKRAIEHENGPAMVIAGPGTGKTSVLTSHAFHLIQNGVHPSQILLVTFTNKAAGEMRERLGQLVTGQDFQVCTFHGLGYQILKEYGALLGRTGPAFIVDQEKGAVLLSELGIEKKSVKKIQQQITEAKQQLQTPDSIEDLHFKEIYTNYETMLQNRNLWDLDDLIQKPVLLFRSSPDVLKHYQQQYPYILVDEYQDVNAAQYGLLRLLTPDSNCHLFVIGDPNQAIYGFRGADVRFIRQFEKDYPDNQVYSLEQSYRCSNTILQASDNILQNESVLRGVDQGLKIDISKHRSDKSEAEFVARTIEQMMGGLRFFSMDSAITTGHDITENSLSDFAVLVRIGHLLEPLKKAFHDHSIPYQTVGNDPLFKSKPISSILNMFWSFVFPEHAFFKSPANLDINQILFGTDRFPGQSIVQLLKKISDNVNDVGKDQQLMLEQLFAFAEPFGTDYENFYRAILLGQQIDTHRPEIEAVTLMTLHASKGLEFPCVFIAGCEDGLLPYHLYHQDCSVDEERRLLYVGMTRARTHLLLSHADQREIRGRKLQLNRSSFLDLIEEEFIEQQEIKIKQKKIDDQLKLF